MASVEQVISSSHGQDFPSLSTASANPNPPLPPTNQRPAKASILSTIQLETLDRNTYRSRQLWTPQGARGVFGGQVIGQALWAAGRTVGVVEAEDPKGKGKKVAKKDEDGEWELHSMHCYFILPADASVPIIYRVERLRDGRSYATRSVVASQDSTPIFHLSCSYNSTPPSIARDPTPSYHEPMPVGVPLPEQCELEEDRWTRVLKAKGREWSEGARNGLRAYIEERRVSPIAIKEIPRIARMVFKEGGSERHLNRNERMLWMRAREDVGTASGEDGSSGIQKCILAFLSDFQFVGTAAQSVGLSHASSPRLGMVASLDHTVYFYAPSTFTTTRWMLHVITSPITASGRGVVQGRFYNQAGELLAVTMQEGVVRAARDGRVRARAAL